MIFGDFIELPFMRQVELSELVRKDINYRNT